MSKTVIFIFASVCFVVLFWVVVLMSMPKKGDVIVYDCRLAEISPDIPIEVKDKCRKLRSGRL